MVVNSGVSSDKAGGAKLHFEIIIISRLHFYTTETLQPCQQLCEPVLEYSKALLMLIMTMPTR